MDKKQFYLTILCWVVLGAVLFFIVGGWVTCSNSGGTWLPMEFQCSNLEELEYCQHEGKILKKPDEEIFNLEWEMNDTFKYT